MKASPTQNLVLGASLLTGELVLTIVIASVVKLLEPQIPIFQILVCRYLFCLPLLVIYGRMSLGRQFLKVTNTRILFLRTVCGFIGLLLWYLAIATIDISLATVLLNTMPLFITLLSALIAHESIGMRRTLAVIFGFGGVLLILLPIRADFSLIGAFYSLLGALFAGLMFVFIRMLGKSDASISTAIWYNAFGALASGIICTISTDFQFADYTKTDALHPWATLIAIGIMASFQQFFLAESHRYADASALAPLHYLSIPFSVIFGIILFGDIITLKFIIGALVIVTSSCYIFLKERSLGI
jgi:drug/metabolite transporter (DMT)-like permease